MELISSWIYLNPSSHANIIPCLTAPNYVILLAAKLIFRENLAIHSPMLFRSIPPTPIIPGLLRELSSVLIFM